MTAQYPLDILGTAKPLWKWTSPAPGAPEIKPPQLALYSDDYIQLTPARDAIQFRAPSNGGTTSGSEYPRSELRELNPDGSLAAWDIMTGQHSLLVQVAVTKLAAAKPHVVVAQIHGKSNDITVWRLEGSSLWITDGNTSHGYLVTDKYTLGDKLLLGFNVVNGVIGYTFNGQPVNYAKKAKADICYFKTGCYNQCNQGSDYAEVLLYGVLLAQNNVSYGDIPIVQPDPAPAPQPDPTPVDPPKPTPPPVIDPNAVAIAFLQGLRMGIDDAIKALGG